MIVYDKFWARCHALGISQYKLRQEGISPRAILKLRSGGNLSTVTIDQLCRLLRCQPGDILEYRET